MGTLEKIERLGFFCKELTGIKDRDVLETIVQKPHPIFDEAIETYYLLRGTDISEDELENKYKELLKKIPVFDKTDSVRNYGLLYNNYFLVALYDKYLQAKKTGRKYAVMSNTKSNSLIILLTSDITEHSDRYKYIPVEDILRLPENTMSALVEYGTVRVYKSDEKTYCIELQFEKHKLPIGIVRALKHFKFGRIGAGTWRGRSEWKIIHYLLRLCKSYGMEVIFGKEQVVEEEQVVE